MSALVVVGQNLYVGGDFSTINGTAVANIAKWDGTAWSALGSGLDYGVAALAVSGTNVFVGGGFTKAGGASALFAARWDASASTWFPLGSGLAIQAIHPRAHNPPTAR